MNHEPHQLGTDFDLLKDPPFPLTTSDREVLSCKDEDFHRYTWQDLQRIVSSNTLEELKRLPSDLHRYLRWSYDTKTVYGSITNFVVQERLHWKPKHMIDEEHPLSATSFDHHSTMPFEDRRDYSILMNDWPYGFAPGISHIVAWSRTPIAVDDVNGDVTSESRANIQEFIRATFLHQLAVTTGIDEIAAAKRVLWFKNWVSLQSVRGVDHIHVLIKDLPQTLVQHWTADNPIDLL